MRKGGAILAVAAALIVGAVPTSAAARFCEGGVIHDYTKPLKQMPEIRRPPLNEHLPFGPARVFLGQIGPGPLLIGGGEVGFGLSFSPFYPGHHLSPSLNWGVVIRVARVDRWGRTTEVVGLLEKQVTRLRSTDEQPSGDLALSPRLSKPALYRVEITISDADGKRLGRYGEYLRVLRPSLDAGISLNKTSFYPGETVVATLENPGTDALFYGLGYGIEGFDGSSWGRAPISPSGPVPAIGLGTGPGEKSSCWNFPIPANAAAGLYRFAWSGEAIRGPFPPGRRSPLALYSEFQILPPL
jgi:hypothetical protein